MILRGRLRCIKRGNLICKMRQTIFTVLFFSCVIPCLYSQTAGQERRVRIPWLAAEYTDHYEVEIEKEDSGEYREHKKEVTEELFNIISLPQGEYRYRVTPRNILGEAGEASRWRFFEVPPPAAAATDEQTAISEPDDSTGELLIISEPEETTAGSKPEADALTAGAEHDKPIARSEPEAGGQTAAGKPEAAAAKTNVHLNIVGVSIGTTFTAPLLIGTIRGTYAPFRNSFFELGLDLGLGCAYADIGHFSLCPFVHYSAYVPLDEKIGIYAGAGGGFIAGQYYFSKESVPFNTCVVDFITGFTFMSFLDASYTLRTNFNGVNHKISIGYVYRFKQELASN